MTAAAAAPAAAAAGPPASPARAAQLDAVDVAEGCDENATFLFNHPHADVFRALFPKTVLGNHLFPSLCPEPWQLIGFMKKKTQNQSPALSSFFARREERQARKMQQELADLLGSASSITPSLLNSATIVFSGQLAELG
jgi:hypothetical protein